MANGKKSGGKPPGSRTPKAKAPQPPAAARPGPPPTEPAADFKATDVRLARIERLAAELAAGRSIGTARELASEAKILEEYFRTLRLQALAAAEGEASLEAIRSRGSQRAAALPIPPLQPLPPTLLPGSPPETVVRVSRQAAFPSFGRSVPTPPQGQPLSRTGGDAPPDGQPGIELSDFFEHVCESIVTAQRQLDISSLAYAMDCQGSPVPPSLFSIPNVKAEVKIGFSAAKDKGIKAIIFNDSSQIQQYGESTVSFEVVAAPPPPGGLDRLAQPTRFLFPGPERDNLFTAVDGRKGQFSTDAQAILDALWKTRAVVLRLPQGATGLLNYLVMAPAPPSRLLVLQITDEDHMAAALTKGDDIVGSFGIMVSAIRAALDAIAK